MLLESQDAFLAFRNTEDRRLATALLASCLLPMVFLLMYFNTGWYQFGYRFFAPPVG